VYIPKTTSESYKFTVDVVFALNVKDVRINGFQEKIILEFVQSVKVPIGIGLEARNKI